ncbi:hypothetical protein QTP70_010940 [Hemibagrus guttatus]|uniref:ribonuclease H n=1 Tax=Hemibagrus guttatus TaxID=175788 RepID=A0AAE0QML2_9TELE|nr:hypothetical protein QTP70_010940 [Hemibagrus guttatus]
MGRGSPIPPMLRRKIVEQYQKGVSQRKIAKSLKLSSSTVHNIIQRFRESATVSVRKGQGRKTILDARDLRALRWHCIPYRNATVMEITTWAQKYFQKTLSVNTIHCAIRRCWLKLYRSKKKPYLNMIQKRRRFLWAKAHLKWTVAKWKTVLWSDKSKFEVLFGKLGRHVIRTKEDKDNPCQRSVQKPASLMYKRHLSTTSNSQTPNSTMAKTKDLSKDTRNKIVDLHQAGKTESTIGCELEEKERSWSELDEVLQSIPTGERVVIGADFNGHVDEGNTGDEEVMGKFGVKERNLEGQMVVDFAKRMDMALVNTYFQKREEHRMTYKSGVMDQFSEEVRQESLWTMMFADDIVICSESREQVEENLERWKFALERRGMKVNCSKTEYMCVNEREGNGTVRLQGEEVKKVQEFKYLGSTVQSNGECGKEVKKRVQTGWNGWRKVSGVLCEENISENQGEGVQDSGETGHAVWFRDIVTEEETGVRARGSRAEDVEVLFGSDKVGQD